MDTAELAGLLATPGTTITLEHTFTHGRAVRVAPKGRRAKGVLLLPKRDEGQSLADVLKMLGDLAEEKDG